MKLVVLWQAAQAAVVLTIPAMEASAAMWFGTDAPRLAVLFH
jgi:hypothetical protein